MKEAPVAVPFAHFGPTALPKHADDDGCNARPSRAKLAEYVHVSTRTINTKLRLLEQNGLIVRGDQQQVAHLRGDRRPVVWDLDLRRTRKTTAPDDDEQDLPPENGVKDFPPVDGVKDFPPVDEERGEDISPRTEHEGKQASYRTEHEGKHASPRAEHSAEHGGKASSYRTVPLTTSVNSDVVNYSAVENGSHQSANGTGTTITGNESSPVRDDAETNGVRYEDLASHLPPGAWMPPPAAIEEAKSIARLVSIKLHLARYRVVKKETNKPPNTAEWLRWLIEDEKQALAEERRVQQASRQKPQWYSVAD